MTDITTFIGIDLAWKSDKNHSSVVVARRSVGKTELIGCSKGLATLEAVFDYVKQHTTEHTVVAIDAPLIINNQTGQRRCETLIGQRFWRQHACAHTSNLRLYPDAGSIRLEAMLREIGFLHQPCPAKDARKPGKWIFEVYPHPAQIVLFNLESTIKYKRGRVAQRKSGLNTFRGYIQDRLVKGTPSLSKNEMLSELLAVKLDQLSGKSLKQYEDLLDACFCAYLALFYWYWGDKKNEMIGDRQTGYIINPSDN